MCILRPSLAVLLVAATAAGCAPRRTDPAPVDPPKPITVFHRLAYEHPEEDVQRAYVLALRARGLAVDTSAPRELRAVTGPAYSPGRVAVSIGPSDTLTTRVTISYEYLTPETPFAHYPWQLPLTADNHLDTTLAIISLPERVHPPTSTGCPPGLRLGSLAGLTEPTVVGGHHRLARAATYTEEARRAEVQGTVYLSAVVGENGGRVSCVEVISGLPMGLTESAIRALTSVEFTPAMRNGRAVPRRIMLPFRFILLEE